MSSFAIVFRTKLKDYTYKLTTSIYEVSIHQTIIGWGQIFGITVTGGDLNNQLFTNVPILGMGLLYDDASVTTFQITLNGLQSIALFSKLSIDTNGYNPFLIADVTRVYNSGTDTTTFTWPARQLGPGWDTGQLHGLDLHNESVGVGTTVTVGSTSASGVNYWGYSLDASISGFRFGDIDTTEDFVDPNTEVHYPIYSLYSTSDLNLVLELFGDSLGTVSDHTYSYMVINGSDPDQQTFAMLDSAYYNGTTTKYTWTLVTTGNIFGSDAEVVPVNFYLIS